MQVYFWGTRGSLPASVTAKMVERKIFKALQASRSRKLKSDDAIKAFIRGELPFAVRGSYGGNTSCVEIRGQEDYVLCDAGTGLRDFGDHFIKTTKTGQAELPAVFHIFISHLHWDHIQGFPLFPPLYLPGHHIHIYGYHPDLEQTFIDQQNAHFFPVPLKATKADISFHVMEPGKAFDIAGMNVIGIKQNHPGDSYGYCFIKGEKKIVYSTDSEHKEDAEAEDYAFIEFFKHADLLIFDAQYSLLDAVYTKENWGHSSNLMGVELAMRAGVRRLCLFHSEHTYDDESLDRFLNDTREYLKILDPSSPLEIYLAYDGMEMEI